VFFVTVMCEVLKASRSGYFGWLATGKKMKRKVEDAALISIVRKIHKESRKTYGSPRILLELKDLGIKCGKARLEKLMRENGIRAKMKKKFKVTTDSKHKLPVSENIANRDFNPAAPDRLWMGDITYIWTREGWLYLAIVMDAYARKIVGWSMSKNMKANLVLDALDMAYKRRKPGRGLIFHSDRGSQYASADYQRRLWQYGITGSMSRKGNCWDNAPAESFFHTLKTEHVYFEDFLTRDEARESVFEWIEVFYNRQRRHSSLGYFSPECYELGVLAKCA
jgi:putative transposase